MSGYWGKLLKYLKRIHGSRKFWISDPGAVNGEHLDAENTTGSARSFHYGKKQLADQGALEVARPVVLSVLNRNARGWSASLRHGTRRGAGF